MLVDRKTRLIAKREYVENIRTKTFWIGILLFPVIWALILLVPGWLAKRKSVRNYAILDKTANQAFSKEFDRRAERPDLFEILEAVKAARDANEELEQRFPPALVSGLLGKAAAGVGELDSLSDEQKKQLEEARASGMVWLALDRRDEIERAVEAQPWLASLVGSDTTSQFLDELQEVLDWWRNLPREEAAKYSAGTSETGVGRFARVEIPGDEAVLRKRLEKGELFAFFVVPEDPVGNPKAGGQAFKYVTNQENLADNDLKKWFKNNASKLLRDERVAKLDLSDKDAEWLNEGVRFDEKRLGEGGKEEAVTSSDKLLQWAPVVFVYLLWISVFTIANLLLTNTIEEKSNRIIEVLLSSVSPKQLMIGKTLGLAATGLTMVGFWVLFAYGGIKLLPLISEGTGATIANWGIEKIVGNPRYLLSFLVYFAFGYLLYAALLVGIGSVCNSLKEAQNLMQPVIIFLFVPLLAMIPIAQDPNGTLAKVLSYIPLFSPFIMMNRAGGPPSMIEYAVTTVILIVSVWIAFWFAAKIFRVGILMTGKPPKIREMIGWLRAPVGSVPVRED